MPGSSTVPQSPRHDSNVRLLLYREASWPLDHREKCRREDSNLGKTYASGSEPLPVDHLGTATGNTGNRLPAQRPDAATRIRAWEGLTTRPSTVPV